VEIYCISDEDTNLMFELIGIPSILIDESKGDDFISRFSELLRDESIGLVIMNEKYLVRYPEFFKEIKQRNYPIIIEIPDIKAPLSEGYFQHFIEQYIGLSAKESVN